jgi:hypothetical protein
VRGVERVAGMGLLAHRPSPVGRGGGGSSGTGTCEQLQGPGAVDSIGN